MQNKNIGRSKRACLACGQVHQGEKCPLIKKKLDKYNSYKKKNFLIGNIFLKCIEKQVDFFQILREIAEQNEQEYDLTWQFNTVLPIDSFIEYFALSLGCSSRDFFKDPQKTLEEFNKLLFVSYSESPFIDRDENSGKVDRINIPFEISKYTEVNSPIWRNTEYTYTLSKERIDDDRWDYNLYVEIPDAITQRYEDGSYQKNVYPLGRTYYFSDMRQVSAIDFLLASDCNGILESLFEFELDSAWTNRNLIQDIHLDDERYGIWINKLLASTKERQLQWCKYEVEKLIMYETFYEQTEIQLRINENVIDAEEIYFDDSSNSLEVKRRKKCSGTNLYIRNRKDGLGVCFRNLNYDEEKTSYDGKAVTLARMIDLCIADEGKDQFLSELKSRIIEHTDILVMTYSMICHNHSIVR